MAAAKILISLLPAKNVYIHMVDGKQLISPNCPHSFLYASWLMLPYFSLSFLLSMLWEPAAGWKGWLLTEH